MNKAENLIFKTVFDKAISLNHQKLAAHDLALEAVDDYQKGRYKRISDITNRKIKKVKKTDQ